MCQPRRRDSHRSVPHTASTDSCCNKTSEGPPRNGSNRSTPNDALHGCPQPSVARQLTSSLPGAGWPRKPREQCYYDATIHGAMTCTRGIGSEEWDEPFDARIKRAINSSTSAHSSVNQVVGFDISDSGVVRLSDRLQLVPAEDRGGSAADASVASVDVIPWLGEGAGDHLVDLLARFLSVTVRPGGAWSWMIRDRTPT